MEMTKKMLSLSLLLLLPAAASCDECYVNVWPTFRAGSHVTLMARSWDCPDAPFRWAQFSGSQVTLEVKEQPSPLPPFAVEIANLKRGSFPGASTTVWVARSGAYAIFEIDWFAGEVEGSESVRGVYASDVPTWDSEEMGLRFAPDPTPAPSAVIERSVPLRRDRRDSR